MAARGSKAEVTRFLEAWFAVRQVIQAANFNRFQGAGLSATQFMTLNLLPAGTGGLAMGELARRLNLKPATVAKTVDSLEARKLVTRLRDAQDKRVVTVQVTDAGAELQNAANGHFRLQIQKIFSGMEPGERAGLIAGLESVVRAAGSEGEPPESGHSGGPTRGGRAALPAKRSARQSPPG